MVRKPLRRSVSPFGSHEPDPSPFEGLVTAFVEAFGSPSPEEKPQLKSWSDAKYVPDVLKTVLEATANDAPDLGPLCQFLVVHRLEFEGGKLNEVVFEAMEQIFNRKTELFLIAQESTKEEESPEGKVTTVEATESVLFARERDLLVGRFFHPVTESNPGLFSEFVTRWLETDNPDRLLHFLDFASRANDPTFDDYLVFSHSSLRRVITSKDQMRSLLRKVEPSMKKLNTSAWAARVRQTFGN